MDSQTLKQTLSGKFLVFEGPDGAGKSTQRDRMAEALRSADVPFVVCRDPGGTQIGDRIRAVLLDHDLTRMDVNCETLLFMASRAQLVSETIKPALAEGKTVLCDRFVTSTCAYQGAAGFDPQRVIELARFAIGDCWPDLTLVFDVDVKDGFDRIGRKPHHAGKRRGKQDNGPTLFDGSGPDAMEARPIEFHRRVRELFLDIQQYYPTTVVTVDGRGDVDSVHHLAIEVVARVLG